MLLREDSVPWLVGVLGKFSLVRAYEESTLFAQTFDCPRIQFF